MVKESSLAMNYRLLSQESSSSHAVILLPSKVTAGLSCRAPNKFNQTRKLKQLIKKNTRVSLATLLQTSRAHID